MNNKTAFVSFSIFLVIGILIASSLAIGEKNTMQNTQGIRKETTMKWETPIAKEFFVSKSKESFSAVPTPDELGEK